MRKFLHVTVGDEDWQPTADDLKQVTELFLDAATENNLNLIVTPHQVKSQLHDDTDNILAHAHVNSIEDIKK